MIFTTQVIRLFLNTMDEDLPSATDTFINYEKPNGQTGSWAASIDALRLMYITNNADLDVPGVWEVQAAYQIDGGNILGKIAYLTVDKKL